MGRSQPVQITLHLLALEPVPSKDYSLGLSYTFYQGKALYTRQSQQSSEYKTFHVPIAIAAGLRFRRNRSFCMACHTHVDLTKAFWNNWIIYQVSILQSCLDGSDPKAQHKLIASPLIGWATNSTGFQEIRCVGLPTLPPGRNPGIFALEFHSRVCHVILIDCHWLGASSFYTVMSVESLAWASVHLRDLACQQTVSDLRITVCLCWVGQPVVYEVGARARCSPC